MTNEQYRTLLAMGKDVEEDMRRWFQTELGEAPANFGAFLRTHPGCQLPIGVLDDRQKSMRLSLHTAAFNGLPHRHKFFEILYVMRGSAVDAVNGEEVTLAEGDLCLHHPCAVHCVTASADAILLNILVSRETMVRAVYSPMVGDRTLDNFFHRYISEGQGTDYILKRNVSETAKTVFDLLISEYCRTTGVSGRVMESALLLLFADLLRGGQTDSTDFSSRLLAYLTENLTTATLTAAANYFGYHPKYFSVLVSKSTNKTFRELLSGIRMKSAADYLMYTDLPIEKIAERTGYRDAVSLYTNFKRLYGVTPATYRATNKGKINNG